MREAEQRLTEEQETMLGLQVEPNKVFWQSEFLRPFLEGLLFWWILSWKMVERIGGFPGVGVAALQSSHVLLPCSSAGGGLDAR